MKKWSRIGRVSTVAAALAVATSAQTLTTELVADGFHRPAWVGSPPQDERIFVIEHFDGRIRIIEDGEVLDTPFLDIGDEISIAGDQGLLGMAFHPGFAQNGIFFVDYTGVEDAHTDIARYRVSPSDPNLADPGSKEILLEIEQPKFNHNGGHLLFHPLDGYLYVPMGDGGGAHDPDCRAQDLSVLQGKLLRIDVDGGEPYAIPPDNPFGNEIFGLGLRNPWRIAFDPVNGDLYVGDVGQSLREEITYVPAPLAGPINFGWPTMEGDLCHQQNADKCAGLGIPAPGCFDATFTDPAHVYVNGDEPTGQGHVVIGGVVYRGCAMPELQGTYFFADNHSGRYWSLRMQDGVKTEFQERTAELSGAGARPTHFGYDPDGEILITDLFDGTVSRVVAVRPPALVDCDGDGQGDDCEVALDAWKDADGDGTIDSCESFSADAGEVSVGAGGVQNLALHPGAEHAGLGYLVLGSISGTSPGLDLGGGVVVPLNPDPYFDLSIHAPNGLVPFDGTLGVLDAAGEAGAQIHVAPDVLPSLAIGLDAYHAFVLFDGAPSVSFASNFTSVRFAP